MNRWHSTPAELYSLVEQTPASVLLECARPAPPDPLASASALRRDPCHTRLFTAPLRVLKAHQPGDLSALFTEIESAVAAGFYAAGYFAYECGAFFEPTAASPMPNAAASKTPEGSASQPIAWFGIYNQPALFDHRTGDFLHGESLACGRFPAQDEGTNALPACAFALDQAEYATRVEAILEKIRAGDIYQLNFTCRLRIDAPGSVAALYRRLHARQPAPYAAFLHLSLIHI